jgi:hypothetical protein
VFQLLSTAATSLDGFESDEFGRMIRNGAKTPGSPYGKIGSITTWIYISGARIKDLLNGGDVIGKIRMEQLEAS